MKSHIVKLEKYAKSLDFECTSNEKYLKVTHGQTAFTLHIEVHAKNKIYIYCSVRLSSWQVIDERTDFHEILSILFTSFVRTNSPNWNGTFADMEHPVIDAPTEIYLRQIIFTQPQNGENSFVVFNVDTAKKLIEMLHSFNYLTRHFIGFDHFSDRNFVLPCLELSWEKELKNAFGEMGELYQIKSRVNPDWFHYINTGKGISMIKSKSVSYALKLFISKAGKQKQIRYGKYDLIFNKNNRNVLKRQLVVDGYKALNSFGVLGRFYKLVLDGCIIIVKGDLIFICYTLTGKDVIEHVKKEIIHRRMLENKYLFKKEAYKWNKLCDPDLFENFCLNILKVLPQTISVRKASPLNEPDEGMDIIWEVQSISPKAIGENIPPFIIERIVVQCKTSAKPIGKNLITDVSDIIEYHDASGYHLMTSAPSVTRTLRNYLLKKKDRGFTVDWWSSIEIEDIVDKHPQLLSGYESILKMV
ncbi:restriction endonuclease [Pseudoalteromonas shioyasakiensis]|uniref:restriction endonuclease n=1 Tax=Pseudoalteromonas shioyasakiensis TaxID=1190813 RepID=UPI0021187AFF|nr:restriction endonuclease [Pseudoalteromonas shioyasakiensis]MCQ8880705.1 restriction endonuclease [Pseudoalteromonas shioyasakiensis]